MIITKKKALSLGMCKDCVIGNGFVGTNLLKQLASDTLNVNSSNIDLIDHKDFNNVYCCCPSGYKYKANKEPYKDFNSILDILKHLRTIKAKNIFLISSQDANSTMTSDENYTEQPPTEYGRNRLFFENSIKQMFDNVYIIRLGMLFGDNLKKNIIYDLLHGHCLENITKDYTIQLYNIDNLLKDIRYFKDIGYHKVNRFSEPILISEVIEVFINNGYLYNFDLLKTNGYNNKGVLISKQEILKELDNFIKCQR